MSKVLQCCHLSKSYKQGDIETKVLNDLDLSVDKGELLAVVGSSGCWEKYLFTPHWRFRFAKFRHSTY